MKQAVGTKRVNFAPLNRLDYNILRGWDLPADEDGTDEGYLVEHVDGGKANLAGYTGYVSWSPKDVFEGSYKESGNFVPLTFTDRLVTEYKDLKEKSDKLTEFISTTNFQKVSELQQDLLNVQLTHMVAYLSVLKLRIDDLNNQ